MSEKEAVKWKPACDLKHLRLRAQMLAAIRGFFDQREVLEVETPLLCHKVGTDPQLDFFSSFYHCLPDDREMFLQTSPEFAMKRLLAAGSGSIYQICKAFRQGELGRLHNPEFTILEWYRVGFTLEQMMDEAAELIVRVLNQPSLINTLRKISYRELFEQVTGLNPLVFSQQNYASYAQQNGISDAVSLCEQDHSLWLDYIFSHKVQAVLIDQSLCMVYDYPAIQSSLARINPKNNAIADRFEVFVNGIEIGNGFFELADAEEQESRFDLEIKSRAVEGKAVVEKDQLFLQALKSGLPECCGIAIGLDRLLMLRAELDSLDQVITFPFDRA